MPGEDNESGRDPLYRTTSNSVAGSPRLASTPARNTDNMDSSGRENRLPPTPASAGYGSIAAQESENVTDPTQPANRQEGARPPAPARQPMSRRSSTAYVGPRRGQNFSTDDAADEYQSDANQRQSARSNTGYGTPLRRQTSNLRRRQTMQTPSLTLPRVDSSGEEENQAAAGPKSAPHHKTNAQADEANQTSGEETLQGEDAGAEDDEDEDDVSDAESFTLRDRQQAINETHPFGIRIWKPALYKKNRSVEKSAEGDIHSAPGGRVNQWLWFFNLVWTVLFGWWLALIVSLGAVTCFAFGFAPDAAAYGRLLSGLAIYVFYPFGRFVKLEQDEAYAEEDEGDGRSITEYEQWQSGDLEGGRLFFGPPNSASIVGRRRTGSIESADENDSLLGHSRSGGGHDSDDGNRKQRKPRLFGRGQWTFGRVLFFIFFYFLIAPCLLFVSGICWFMVFWIPMGRVTALLYHHLRRHPLALSFHSDGSYSRGPSSAPSSILLCTYRAVGLKYWKYTIDGTNIFLFNLLAIVLFTIFDYYILDEVLGLHIWLTHPGLLFCLGLFSVIPLAYFIGQAVASISAQSSMGLGAAINAFFSTVVEVFLYCVALNQGKAQLVEGSIIGSIFAGILFLPGLSMCFGATRRKTQRFNVKSAGVTSTMLLFAMIAAFGPTLFYQIYGSHELNCHACTSSLGSTDTDCRRCFYSQVPAVNDRFFLEAVRPFCWFAAALLFVSYLLGLWFTLRTHAAVIWNDIDEKKPGAPAVNGIHHGTIPTVSHQAMTRKPSASNITLGSASAVKDSQLYQRILGQSLKQIGLETVTDDTLRPPQPENGPSLPPSSTPHVVPPKGKDTTSFIEGLSAEQNEHLARQVVEVAATAAAVAARDAYRSPRLLQGLPAASPSPAQPSIKKTSAPPTIIGDGEGEHGAHEGGGHDAPNWSRLKSTVILLGATLLYAIIAEILVNTVDVVLENVDIDEKFLGITLFALVPNTTEFLNAISFAMNGNIALSMEIGSAYALQVCLLQIPALVLYSAFHGLSVDSADLINHTFNLIFPQWDMVVVILCVFLLSYVYSEGKSNYFKGGILVLAYLVIMVGFYASGFAGQMYANGIDRFELQGSSSHTFKTIGRSTSGQAF